MSVKWQSQAWHVIIPFIFPAVISSFRMIDAQLMPRDEIRFTRSVIKLRSGDITREMCFLSGNIWKYIIIINDYG
jgi:hypothetical protein